MHAPCAWLIIPTCAHMSINSIFCKRCHARIYTWAVRHVYYSVPDPLPIPTQQVPSAPHAPMWGGEAHVRPACWRAAWVVLVVYQTATLLSTSGGDGVRGVRVDQNRVALHVAAYVAPLVLGLVQGLEIDLPRKAMQSHKELLAKRGW